MKNILIILLFISIAGLALAGTTHKRFHKRQYVDGQCCRICKETCYPGCTIDYINNSPDDDVSDKKKSHHVKRDSDPTNDDESIPIDDSQGPGPEDTSKRPPCCNCTCNPIPEVILTDPIIPTPPEPEPQEVRKKHKTHKKHD